MRRNVMVGGAGIAACLAVPILVVAGSAAAQCQVERFVSPSPTASSSPSRFGRVLAVGGEHLIVGDPADSTGAKLYAARLGAGGAWSALAAIEPPPGSPVWSGLTAASLDVSRPAAERLAVASVVYTPAGTTSWVHLYEFEGGARAWVHERAIGVPNVSGIMLLHGDLLLIYRSSSRVDVHALRDGEWVFDGTLGNPTTPTMRSDFGAGIAASDGFVAIGAPLERLAEGGRGAAYLFERGPGGTLTLSQRILPPSPTRIGVFGEAVAISDRTLAIGDRIADRPYEDAGVVYLYEPGSEGWSLAQEFHPPQPRENDQFGASVALADRGLGRERLVVGAVGGQTRFGRVGLAFTATGAPGEPWAIDRTIVPDGPASRYGTRVGLAGPDARFAAVSPGGAYVDVFDLARTCCGVDLDGDGAATIFDYLAFQTLFDAGDPAADFDGDGALTVFDFLVFQSDFVDGCP